MVATEVSKFTGNADGLSESAQNTGWLHLAQNRVRWRQFAKFGKSPVGAPNASVSQLRPALRGLMLMGAGGVEWFRLAPKAGHGVKNGRLRERLRKRGLASTCYPSLCIKPGLTLSGCPHGTVLDIVGR